MDEKSEPRNRDAGKAGVPHHRVSCACGMCEKIRHQAEMARAKAQQLGGIPTTPAKLATSLRQRKFVKALTNPDGKAFGDPKAAAVAAGYGPRAGEALLKDQDTRRLLLAEMERQGLDEASLVQSMKEGLAAYETKLATRDGAFTDERRIPDSGARQKFLELALRVRHDVLKDSEPDRGANMFVVNLALVEHTPGHGVNCQCWTCCDNFNKKHFQREPKG